MLITYQPLKRLAMKSFMDWTFYKPNLLNKGTRRMFDCMLNQMTLGAKYWRSPAIVLPLPFKDDELRGLTSHTLLLIGQQEAYYDPVVAVARAKRLIPRIRAELIPKPITTCPWASRR